jgi:arylsulfatase
VLADSRTTLAEVLGAAGFRTAAFVSGAYAGRVFGFAQGFARFDGDRVYVRLNVEALLEWLDRERPARFFAYLHVGEVHGPYTAPDPTHLPPGAPPERRHAVEEERGRYAEVDFDPGYDGPVDGSVANLRALSRRTLIPSARDVEHLVALYDRGIAYTDRWIGRLVENLARRGLLERTLIIVTADHGEELFEHGGVEHGKTFFRS